MGIGLNIHALLQHSLNIDIFLNIFSFLCSQNLEAFDNLEKSKLFFTVTLLCLEE